MIGISTRETELQPEERRHIEAPARKELALGSYVLCVDTRKGLGIEYLAEDGPIESCILVASPAGSPRIRCQGVTLPYRPGPDSSPWRVSRADMEIARKLNQAAEVLGMQSLDHVIISRGFYQQMKRYIVGEGREAISK